MYKFRQVYTALNKKHLNSRRPYILCIICILYTYLCSRFLFMTLYYTDTIQVQVHVNQTFIHLYTYVINNLYWCFFYCICVKYLDEQNLSNYIYSNGIKSIVPIYYYTLQNIQQFIIILIILFIKSINIYLCYFVLILSSIYNNSIFNINYP